ncbi:hypothetical protein [Streptomyces sp. NPDC006971]
MTAFHSWDGVKRDVFDTEDLEAVELGARRWSPRRERTAVRRSSIP